MPDPIRLTILKQLTTLLEAVTVADPSGPISMVGKVYRGRGVFGNETPVPAISILEAPIPPDPRLNSNPDPTYHGLWELVIQGWGKDDLDNPTDPAHPMLADTKRLLAIERQKLDWDEPEEGILGLGRSVTNLYIGSGVVRPPDELSSKCYFWLTLGLDIVENMADPYGH